MLPGPAAQVADDVRQLDVHLGQHLLHPLDARADCVHVVAALAPVRADDANLGRRVERVAEQPVGVELEQPLALLHVGLAPGEVLGVPRVHQIDLKTARVEDLVDGNPVDARGLERDGGHPTLLQPLRQALQIGGEALEPADRVRIPIGPDRHVVRTVTDVDPGGVGMHNLQARVLGPQPARPFLALLPIQSGWRCGYHVGPPHVSQTRCGPVAKGV
jgi:hypothetical protein